MLLAFHKPYGILSQFQSDDARHRTLAGFGFPPHVYPIGRLDADSEGLLLLSDEAALNERLLHPRHTHAREYWVEVEGIPAPGVLRDLEHGVVVQGRQTLPCRARVIDPAPSIAPRVPPIRVRKSIPTCWIAIELVEGRNRQVRRMTASVGHPTLRLLRVRIGAFELGDLASGEWRELSSADRARVLATPRGR